MARNDNNKSASILGAIAAGVAEGGGGGGGGGVAGVSTFKGRSGNVYPANNDYSASMVSTDEAGKTVQNKLDELATSSVIDDALSPTSERAVENKVITEAIAAVDAKTLPSGGNSGDLLARGNSNDAVWESGSNFMLKSDYDTNNNGYVDFADKALALYKDGTYVARLKTISGDTYVLTELDKGKANGICPLDTNKKIPLTHLPDAVTSGMTYGGIFNPQTRIVRLTPQAKEILGVTADTMTLVDSPDVPAGYPANVGLFYITTASGTFASMTFTEGDWLMSLGTQWTQVSLAVRVSSVNGKTGAVTLDSDDITEGVTNLYLTPALKTKLEGIENEATKDTNVIQTAQIITDLSGNEILRLTNKNGSVVEFQGGGGDLADYLRKDGNASNTFVRYTPSTSRQAFTGNERMEVMMAKIVTWLNALEDVAFTGAYNDLSNRPTRVSQFTNDAGYITRTVNNLSNYYTTAQTYTRDEIEAIVDAISSFTFIEVPELPTTGINDQAIYYVPLSGSDGYSRYQHMNGQWLFLGTTDVNMDGYLMSNGNGSNVTVTFTTAAERIAIATGDTLAVAMGKLSKYIADMQTVCFTASWHDLVDGNELATQDDLDEKVDIQQAVAQAGKVLGIGDDGKVLPVSVSTGVVRKGAGANSVIGNDSEDDPTNYAAGAQATALGNHTKASGADQLVYGRYNVEDTGGNYVEIVGNGDPSNPTNIKTTDWTGKGWYKNGISVGNTSSSIVTPTAGNDLTTKTYVDGTIDTKIAEANLLKSMVVTVLPDVDDADPNILYLIEDPTHAETYLTYKKVLESQDPDVWVMAAIGSTQVSASSIQVTELPTPSLAYNNAVYQYIGSGSGYKFGRFYTCKSLDYYAWLSQNTAQTFFTRSATPVRYDKLYRSNFSEMVNYVMSVSGNTLTDNAANNYTRLSAQDTSHYEWVEIGGKLSEYTNDGTGTGAPNDYFITKEAADTAYNPNLTAGTAITSVADGTKISQVSLSTDKVSDITALQMFQYVAQKIYPVGSIYTSTSSTSPATLFGGTWSQIGDGYYLRASSSGAGNTLNAQLPNVTGSFSFASGSQGHAEVSSPSGAFKTSTNGNLTYPWPTDGTSGGPRTVNFALKNFNNDLYVDSGAVQPKSYKVYMWRRTA